MTELYYAGNKPILKYSYLFKDWIITNYNDYLKYIILCKEKYCEYGYYDSYF